MLRDLLRLQGLPVGRRHVSALLKTMGSEALDRHPNPNRKHPPHPVFPDRFCGLAITRPNRVRAMDISPIPRRKGFVSPAAARDWTTRRGLAWRLSNTLTTDCCLEAVEEALPRSGKPQIFPTSKLMGFTSAGMAKAAAATTCSSNDCGTA